MDLTQRNETGGNGLSNIEKRVKELKGKSELKSEPGSGTEWTIRIPL
jgi:signal transduction histidine kinase